MSEMFHEKWDQAYRRVKQRTGLSLDEQTRFGAIESFDKKKVGSYHIIKNTSYAQYKSKGRVIQTKVPDSIQLPFTAEKFHFEQTPYFQVIAFVDLEKCRLIYPNKYENQEFIKGDQYQTEHIIKISKAHIAHGHSIYVPYVRKHLPQVLTQKLIRSIIKLSGILPNQKIGYNSQGGSSSVNNFHVQIINGESLLNNNKFHFQQIQGKVLPQHFADILRIPSKGKIEMRTFQYAHALYIRISSKQHKIYDEPIIDAVIGVTWAIIKIALEKCIPHNLNIPNSNEFYIILRDFDVNYGWVQYSGVQITTNDYDFQHVSQEKIQQQYTKIAFKSSIFDKVFKSG